MDKYNLIIIGFIIAAFFLSLWWAFNTVRRIELQKNFCVMPLSSIAKLWHKAKFVPEDAKERESLYLYRDFLRKFDDEDCQYPIMVKDGGVRCMTRKEYDNLCGQKNIRNFSILITLISLILAVASIVVNLLITKTIWMGIGLAVIMPAVEIALAIFIARFNKDKNSYRDGIFMALKENSVDFLRITKPFIIVDAYPHKFGKNQKPLYVTMGKIDEKQIIETRDFIIRQKEAETKIIMSNVDNEEEIQRVIDKTTKKPVVRKSSTVAAKTQTVAANPTATAAPAPQPTPRSNKQALADEEKEALITKMVDDLLLGEVEREIKKAAQQAPVEVEPVENVKPIPVETVENVAAPAEDDFSLDAIGQALDAEIAKRNKRR